MLFEKAKKYYSEARDILIALADSVPDEMVEGTREANRRATVRQYNVILQTVMLACAVADGRVMDGEIEFIAALGLEHGGISLDWEALKRYSAEENAEFSEELTETVAPVANAFIGKCKEFSRLDPTSYSALDRLTGLLLDAFCNADGQMTREEYAAGRAVLDSFIRSNWQNADSTELKSNGIKIEPPISREGSNASNGDIPDRPMRPRNSAGNAADADNRASGLIGALGGLLDTIGGMRGKPSVSEDRPMIPKKSAGNTPVASGVPSSAPEAIVGEKLPELVLNTADEKLLNYAKNRRDFTNGVIFIRTSVGEGSGFMLTKDGFAATNAHVVGDERNVKVRFAAPLAPQGFIGATVIAKDTVHDLAIIKLESNEYYHCEIDCSGLEAEIGSEVALLGFPLGSNLTDNVEELNISLARGYVSSNQTRNSQRTTFLDIKAFHGNSGGPIVSLDSGLIIGILVGAVLDEAGGLTMMIPVRYLTELVEKFK